VAETIQPKSNQQQTPESYPQLSGPYPAFPPPAFTQGSASFHGQERLTAATLSTAQQAAATTPLRQLGRFWIKINRDWMFNLAGMLAYNLLLAAFPLLIVSISLLGIIFQQYPNACSPNHLEGQIISSLASVLPTQISGLRPEHGHPAQITSLCAKLSHESALLGLVGIITGLWFGSRLFVKIENCFGVIFRLRSRSFLRQNGTALGMTALFVVLAPLSVAVTVVPERLLEALGGPQTSSSVVSHLIGSLIGAIIAFFLLELIYVVVPNQRVRAKDVWGGALVAALLLSAYELLFPLYARYLASSNSYGAVAGLLVIVLLFFYYFANIILLGAEINSWYHGHQESSGDVATMLAQANRPRPPAS
jgi:membrane protein